MYLLSVWNIVISWKGATVLWSGDLQSYSIILNEGRERGNSWNISEFKYQNIFYGNYFRIKIRFNIILFQAHRSEVVWFIFWTTWQSNHARLLKWFDCIDMIMSVLTALQSLEMRESSSLKHFIISIIVQHWQWETPLNYLEEVISAKLLSLRKS